MNERTPSESPSLNDLLYDCAANTTQIETLLSCVEAGVFGPTPEAVAGVNPSPARGAVDQAHELRDRLSKLVARLSYLEQNVCLRVNAPPVKDSVPADSGYLTRR